MRVDSWEEALGAVAVMCRSLTGLPESTVFNARLVACELLSNAVKYGGGCARFTFSRVGDTVRLAVRGQVPFDPPPACTPPDPAAENGRGLYLVDALADRRDYSDEEGIIVFIGT